MGGCLRTADIGWLTASAAAVLAGPPAGGLPPDGSVLVAVVTTYAGHRAALVIGGPADFADARATGGDR